jgi:hypothetical protein
MHAGANRVRLLAGSLAAGAVLGVLCSVAPANASTLYACGSRSAGAVRLVAKTARCHSGERRTSWTPRDDATASVAAPGTGGTTPNHSETASAAEGGLAQAHIGQSFGGPVALGGSQDLISIGGVAYSANCERILGGVLGVVLADAPAGEAYSQGAFTRPAGEDGLRTDPVAAADVTALAGEAEAIASDGTLPEDRQHNHEDIAVWTATVEQADAVTWLHLWMDVTPSGCKVRGSVVQLPN